MSRDRDERDHGDDTGVIPTPSTPLQRGEVHRAERFSELVGTLVAGKPLPPAMDPDDRALIDVAGMIRASVTEVQLSPRQARAITSDAIAAATRRGERGERVAPAPGPAPAELESPPPAEAAPSLGRPADAPTPQGGHRLRALPWAVAAVATAAAVVSWVSRPAQPIRARGDIAPASRGPRLADSQRSRPADAVVGRIARADDANASGRIDAIFSDRLAGYRSLAFTPRGQGGRRD